SQYQGRGREGRCPSAFLLRVARRTEAPVAEEFENGDGADEIDQRVEHRNIEEVWPSRDEAKRAEDEHGESAEAVYREDTVIKRRPAEDAHHHHHDGDEKGCRYCEEYRHFS